MDRGNNASELAAGLSNITRADNPDGDGNSNGNAFGYVGHLPFGAACITGEWDSIDMTDNIGRWDLSQFGGAGNEVERDRPAVRGDRGGDVRDLPDTMVDTGSEYTWIPRAVLEDLGIGVERIERFVTADGRMIARELGYAIIHAAGTRTVDEVVFAGPGDMTLLLRIAGPGRRCKPPHRHPAIWIA